MDTMLQSVLEALLSMSPWEMAAVIFAITYLLLAVRENILCWTFAFISTAIYTVLFWDVSLLMESALNVYYMAMAVYGYHQWTRGGTNCGGGQALAIRTMEAPQHALVIGLIVVLTLVSGYLLGEHSSAAWPFVDSFTTWASVITTYLVARKYLENWLYWLVIDSVSVPLYIDRGLYMTALLFVAYIIIVVFGYIGWRRHFQAEQHRAQT